jgi:hypothetical protein
MSFSIVKNIWCLFFILLGLNAFSQDISGESEITHLIYAGKKIPVPKNGTAYSETEIVNCDGISVRWHEFQDSTEAANSFHEIRVHLEKGRESSAVSFISFGSELAGYRMYWPKGKEYLFFLFGIVNRRPINVTISSKSNIETNADLKCILPLIMQIPK